MSKTFDYSFLHTLYCLLIFSFGSLFSGGERLGDPMGPMVNLKYSGAEEVTPALSKERKAIRSPNNDVFDGDTL